jgi:hypothetical protein
VPGLLDYLDQLDTEILRLKVEGTSVEVLLNMRTITHEMRRLISHQDQTGKMIRLDRRVVDEEIADKPATGQEVKPPP